MNPDDAARVLTAVDTANPAQLRAALVAAIHGLVEVPSSADPEACAAEVLRAIAARVAPAAPAVPTAA